jgi:hypothetical protein
LKYTPLRFKRELFIEIGCFNSVDLSTSPPPAPDIFFGRDEYVATAIDLIQQTAPARLAILGAGGIGKTSIALAILHCLQTYFTFSSCSRLYRKMH